MLLAVGGHSRNIGKTSAVAGIIRRLRSRRWAALKITQYGQGVCTHSNHACECGPDPDHPFGLSEEFEPGKTDTGRFLAAGAYRSFWLRTPAGRLFEAADVIRKIIDQNENTIVESNSILDCFDPDLFLMMLDFSCQDFKASSLKYMDRADAFLVIDRGINTHLWPEVSAGWMEKPHFEVRPPAYVTPAVIVLVRSRLSTEPAIAV
jgi:hypothetical protein